MSGTRQIVIVGAGFGGLSAARALSDAPAHVTVVDRENHHLFQPLLYQVATAGLSPGDIAVPIRAIVRNQPHIRVMLGTITSVDFAAREVMVDGLERLGYDYLVLAAGARTNYFDHPEWERHAGGLKSLRDSLTLRERILLAFEAAEREANRERRSELLTFVVIGAGPTGVELAGAISELGRHTLKRDFRAIDPTHIRVVLVEMADRVLTPFDPGLSEKAKRQLEKIGVEVQTATRVMSVDPHGVTTSAGRIVASTVCWASGVGPVPLTPSLGVPMRRGGLIVEQDCSVAGWPEVFAIGDMASFVPDGEERALPGLGAVAMQQGRFVGAAITRELAGKPRGTFRYRDKGIMATIGRSAAVAQTKRLRLSGLLAWLAWLLVHVVLLIGFRNRVVVLVNWVWSYFTFKRGARLITWRDEGRLRALSGEQPVVDSSEKIGDRPE